MQPQRVKSQAELDQEKRDEELARSLQAMMDRPPQQQAPQGQQQNIWSNTAGAPNGQQPAAAPPNNNPMIQRMCPNCNATNQIPRATAYTNAFACGACGRTIPPMSQTNQEGFAPSLGGPEPTRPVQPQPQQNQMNKITCQYCRALNQIPTGTGAAQFMCGGCGRILTFNQTFSAPAPPAGQAPIPSAQIPTAGTTPIAPTNDNAPLQGQPLQGQPVNNGPRQVQARCYQCGTINAVMQNPGQQLQFMCGACRTVNKV